MIHTDGKPTIANRTTRPGKPAKVPQSHADVIAAGFGPLLRDSAKREADRKAGR